MNSLSLKILKYSFFGMAAALFCACMSPVDVPGLLEDENVAEIIKNSQKNVNLAPGSEGTAGSNKITGLDPNKYYMIQEFDDENLTTLLNTSFVGADKKCWGDMSNIGRSNEVNGLNNDHTYFVKSAVALYNDGTSLQYIDVETPTVIPASFETFDNLVDRGEIKIIAPKGTYFLKLDNISANSDYEIANVPDNSSWGNSRTSAWFNSVANVNYLPPNGTQTNYYDKYITNKQIGIFQYRTGITVTGGLNLTNTSLLQLAKPNTITEYVIAEFINSKPDIDNFYVLKVNIGRASGIAVTLVGLKDDSPTPSQTATITYTLGNPPNTNINITNSDTFTAIEWYLSNNNSAAPAFHTGNSFNMSNFETLNPSINNVIGEYIITVVAKKDGHDYTATITVRVNAP